MWQHIIWVGLTIAAVSLFAQAWAIHTGSANWQTMVFTVLTMAELAFCLPLALLVMMVVELEKLFVRRGWLYAPASN